MIQTHPRMFDELLSQINEHDNPVDALKQVYAKHPYTREYINLSVSGDWTTILVKEIEIRQYNYHRSLAGAFLLNRQTWNIVSNVIMNPAAKDTTKNIQFKALSEMLFSEEAKLFKSILEKNISELFPKLTHTVLSESLN